ncbi:MAG: NADH-quinone oxidoreductase subunit NuoF [Bacteroidales bacterium]|jgi:NADH:ubiquinone oxidoreductase subunit F (NADH-binding)|nr:NADH-quinone oxidoreductase subunit NuoF [Bacteroidales bacterium]
MQENRIALKNIDKYDGKSIDSYVRLKGYESFIHVLNNMSKDEVIQEVIKSELRGRGGAGFPAGTKFKFVAASNDDEKYVVCNADEGEPGTFKDRQIMEQDPFLLLEGICIAGYAIGAHKAYIYIRAEYNLAIKRIQKAINQSRNKGFLGENILNKNFNFDIEIKLGAGSYLCGEELTLIESLEGNRGHPRIKPPFPAQKGVFQKPTLINNVETLVHLPSIIEKGSAWYKSLGNNGSTGTKIFSISGDIVNPGYYEFEFGISLRQLIYKVGGGISDGKRIKAVLLGGAAGTFVSEEQLDIAMDFDSLSEIGATLGSGAVIVLHEERKLLNFMENILDFFKNESCGKCVPCRVGTSLLCRDIQKIINGDKNSGDIFNRMLKQAEFMKATSLCPLGKSPVIPLNSLYRYFKDDII